MTPGARVQAAIECLDRIVDGAPAEKALTNWARNSRFAGSKDRAAVRDHVYEALRLWWSSAVRGGGTTGRARMIGALRGAEAPVATLFTGVGHAPAPLSPEEVSGGRVPDGADALDVPDWLLPELERSLGADLPPVMDLMRHRAPPFLRANLRKATRDRAIMALAADGIEGVAHPLSPTAIEVTRGARAIRRCAAYTEGLVEIQDAASQAVVDALPLDGTDRVLDFCAGGGGKSLAMAGRHAAAYRAHDAVPNRMTDVPARAARAGVHIHRLDGAALSRQAPYDLVLVDAPCSGSGSWRRDPEGKRRLTPEGLSGLTVLQDRVLDAAAPHVRPDGVLCYVTCSLLDVENGARVAAFLDRAPFVETDRFILTPLDGGDGFFCAILRRNCGGNGGS